MNALRERKAKAQLIAALCVLLNIFCFVGKMPAPITVEPESTPKPATSHRVSKPRPHVQKTIVSQELVRKASPGQQGWAFVGVFQNGDWSARFNTRYLSAPVHGLPEVGNELTVLFPLTIRSQPTTLSGEQLGQLQINQKIEVKAIQYDNGTGRVWVQVDVTE
jgi:hypothetical protein